MIYWARIWSIVHIVDCFSSSKEGKGHWARDAGLVLPCLVCLSAWCNAMRLWASSSMRNSLQPISWLPFPNLITRIWPNSRASLPEDHRTTWSKSSIVGPPRFFIWWVLRNLCLCLSIRATATENDIPSFVTTMPLLPQQSHISLTLSSPSIIPRNGIPTPKDPGQDGPEACDCRSCLKDWKYSSRCGRRIF